MDMIEVPVKRIQELIKVLEDQKRIFSEILSLTGKEVEPPLVPSKLVSAIIYFLVAVIILGIVCFFRKDTFYPLVRPEPCHFGWFSCLLGPPEDYQNPYHFFRFLWCVSASFLGFSLLVFRCCLSKRKPKTWVYYTYYLGMLLGISALVFSLCHLFPASSGFVFYYLSFAACFMLSYNIDHFWELVSSFIKKG